MSEETSRVTFEQLTEMYRAAVERQGGQGESSGPYFFAPNSDAVVQIDEQEYGPSPIESAMRGQEAYRRWREANGRPVNTGEVTFRLGGGTDYSRSASPTFSERLGVGRQQTGGIMKVSTRGPELTVGEKRALKEGYKSILQQGFGRLGVPDKKLVLWLDDKAYEVRTDNEYWEISGNSLYIGNGTARPGDKLRSVSERLAVTAGLMGLTGHASDPELMVEFEKALARMLAGQFEEAVKPLGVSGDDRPVGKMAWSASGVAAFVDGQWCSPVTGEPVEVGSGWTVIETGEGPREVVPTQPQVAQQRSVAERFQEWLEVNERGNNRRRLEDGRWAFVWYGAGESQRVAGVVELERRFGQPLGELEIGYDEYAGSSGGWWMVPRAVPVAQAASEPARSRSQEDWEAMLGGTVYGVTRGIDGRLGVNTANLNSFEALRGTFGEFDLEYVTPHPTSTMWEGLTVVKWVEQSAPSVEAARDARRRFEEWASGFGTTTLPDGRMAVGFGGGSSEVEENLGRIERYSLRGCVLATDEMGDSVITYPLEALSEPSPF